MERILFQSKSAPEFRFLSNFHSKLMTIDDERWMSVEHYYQASKSVDPETRKMIKNCLTPAEAKKLGRYVDLNCFPGDWEKVKESFMLRAIRAKFTQHADLREKLLLTKGFELVEYAPWGDTYWGVDKELKGQNRLGHLLMQVREELS
mgnify:CR=1 FL=1